MALFFETDKACFPLQNALKYYEVEKFPVE